MSTWLTLAGAVGCVFVAVVGGAISLSLWSDTRRPGFMMLRRVIVGMCFGGLILAAFGMVTWSLICQACVVAGTVGASAARSSLSSRIER